MNISSELKIKLLTHPQLAKGKTEVSGEGRKGPLGERLFLQYIPYNKVEAVNRHWSLLTPGDKQELSLHPGHHWSRLGWCSYNIGTIIKLHMAAIPPTKRVIILVTDPCKLVAEHVMIYSPELAALLTVMSPLLMSPLMEESDVRMTSVGRGFPSGVQ